LKTLVKQNIHIYNENSEIVLLENIDNQSNLISILEVKGIKFTNKSFMFDFEMKQSMVVSPDPFLDVCYIKKPSFNVKTNENISNTNNNITNPVNISNNDTLKLNLSSTNSLDNPQGSFKETFNNDHLKNNPISLANPNDSLNNITDSLEDINSSLDTDNNSLGRNFQIKIHKQNDDIINNIDFNDDEKAHKIEKLIDIIKSNNYDDDNKNEIYINNGKYLEENKKIEKENNNLTLNESFYENYHEDYEDNEENNKTLKIKFSDDIIDDDDNDTNGLLTIYDDNISNDVLKPIEFEEIFDKNDNSSNNTNLQEVDIQSLIEVSNEPETIKLKKPNEVYYNLYKEAMKKAKELKNKSLHAYMEAENIKKTYMIENVDNEESSDEEQNI
jgi:hypothetical protein